MSLLNTFLTIKHSGRTKWIYEEKKSLHVFHFSLHFLAFWRIFSISVSGLENTQDSSVAY